VVVDQRDDRSLALRQVIAEPPELIVRKTGVPELRGQPADAGTDRAPADDAERPGKDADHCADGAPRPGALSAVHVLRPTELDLAVVSLEHDGALLQLAAERAGDSRKPLTCRVRSGERRGDDLRHSSSFARADGSPVVRDPGSITQERRRCQSVRAAGPAALLLPAGLTSLVPGGPAGGFFRKAGSLAPADRPTDGPSRS